MIVTHHITHHLFIQCQIPQDRKATRFERLLRTEFSSVGQDPHIGSHVSTTFEGCPIERESLRLCGPGTLGRNSAYLAYVFKNRSGMSGPCGSPPILANLPSRFHLAYPPGSLSFSTDNFFPFNLAMSPLTYTQHGRAFPMRLVMTRESNRTHGGNLIRDNRKSSLK